MKVMTMFAMVLAAGCSDEADIGVDSAPVTCATDGPVAEVSGSVRDPNTGTSYDFDAAIPSALGRQLTLANDSNQLRFGFYCGETTIARYGVKGDTQEGLECPLEVASVVLGRIEYLPAKSGTMIVDETANCLAGRFSVDFGENGSVTGWFSAPWSQR